MAFSPFAPAVKRTSTTSVSMTAPPGMKPMFDGTFKKAGEHSEQYVLEMDNGARAIVRSYGGNAFSYITKDGVEVMGKRKDAPTPIADTKPYAGGAPHCFPQFGPGALMQHGVSVMKESFYRIIEPDCLVAPHVITTLTIFLSSQEG